MTETSAEKKSAPLTPDYFNVTASPLCGLLFSLPFVIIYEVGRRLFVSDTILSADQFLQGILRYLANLCGSDWVHTIPTIAAIFLIPAMLAWHFYGKYPWKFRVEYFLGLLVESAAYAFLLFVVPSKLMMAAGGKSGITTELVLSFGAGVYEEFVFRVVLMFGLMAFFYFVLKMQKGWAMFGAIVISAVLFSLFHYSSPADFDKVSFVFRTVSGIYFSAIMAFRGFGAAVGAHSLYDVMVTLWSHQYFA